MKECRKNSENMPNGGFMMKEESRNGIEKMA